MTTFEIPASVAANIAKRQAAERARPCLYGCLAPARPYPGGTFCDSHSPWAVAGHPNPDSQVDPTRTADALRARMLTDSVRVASTESLVVVGEYEATPPSVGSTQRGLDHHSTQPRGGRIS